METFSKDAFEFEEVRTVCCDKGTGDGVMGVLGRPDGMRMEGTGNVYGYEEWGS